MPRTGRSCPVLDGHFGPFADMGDRPTNVRFTLLRRTLKKHCEQVRFAPEMDVKMRRPFAPLVGLLVHRLEPPPVGINDEGGVVRGRVTFPEPGRSIVNATVGDPRGVEGVNRGVVGCIES